MRSTIVLPIALALLVAPGVFARPKNEHSVVFYESVLVGSTQLKAGTYKVEWQGDGPSLHLSFLENGKTVATAEGKMVEKDRKSPYDDVVIGHQGKTPKLEEINFEGQKEALVLTPNHSGMN